MLMPHRRIDAERALAHYTEAMANTPLLAHVKNGRLVLDVPTDLPEGAQVILHREDELGEELTAEEHAKLDEEIRLSRRQLEAGEVIGADQLVAQMRSRMSS